MYVTFLSKLETTLISLTLILQKYTAKIMLGEIKFIF